MPFLIIKIVSILIVAFLVCSGKFDLIYFFLSPCEGAHAEDGAEAFG